MAWTYILKCRDGSFYIGSTVNLERRLAQHQAGEGAQYTRHRRPVELVWCAEFKKVRHAYELEKKLQNWSHAKRLALIEGRYDDLPDLAWGFDGQRRGPGGSR